MSKGPEGDGSRRKRRGGLRVPSDEVPRRPSVEVSAPVPEPVGLAASVSEFFGVSDPATEAPPVDYTTETSAAVDMDELPTVVSEKSASEKSTSEVPMSGASAAARSSADAAEAAAKEAIANRLGEGLSAATDLRSTIPMTSQPVYVDESDDLDIPVDEDGGVDDADEEVTDELEGSSLVTGEVKAIAEEEEEEEEEEPASVSFKGEESGESVDIPFDDADETTVNASIPMAPISDAIGVLAQAAKPEEVASSQADSKAASVAEAQAPTGKSGGMGDGKAKKPRFNHALTMALSDSDLEEVRLEDGSRVLARRTASAAPGEEASRTESGEVLDDSALEEVKPSVTAAPEDSASTPTAQDAPVAAVETPEAVVDAEPAPRKIKKRADTAEPPPSPVKAKGPNKAPPAPKAAPGKRPKVKVSAEAEDGKRGGRKPWFEDIFDEDYLRTLPFLTPQATKFEANFVMESLGVDAGAQLLDVGCGYGRHAMELAARGYHMVGLDNSLPLLLRGADEAQRRGLTINFVHGNMREMTFESQFDGAYCLFSSFGYFDDETNKRTAQNIAKALKPGARLVVEVLNRDYLVADLPSRVWWEGDGCVVLEEVEFNYFSSRIVSNRSVVFDDGRQLEHEISLRSFSLHELGKFLHAVGFRVLEISGSMSTRGRFFGAHSRDIVVVAEKRAPKADEPRGPVCASYPSVT
ncbi:MAG: methyltransferase domain-containing protein [Myxococcales bacterium]|nr:methyltransferase domain-containing protein [Myxococcales bacterium]